MMKEEEDVKNISWCDTWPGCIAQLSMPKKKQRHRQNSATIDSDRFHTVRARTVAERAGHPVRAVWNKSFVESVVSYQTEQDNKFVTRKTCRSGLLS